RRHGARLPVVRDLRAGAIEPVGEEIRADQHDQRHDDHDREAALRGARRAAPQCDLPARHGALPPRLVVTRPPPSSSFTSPRVLSSVCPILRSTGGSPSRPPIVTCDGSGVRMLSYCGTPLIQVVVLPDERETCPFTVMLLSTAADALSWPLASRRRSSSWRCCGVKNRRPSSCAATGATAPAMQHARTAAARARARVTTRPPGRP